MQKSSVQAVLHRGLKAILIMKELMCLQEVQLYQANRR